MHRQVPERLLTRLLLLLLLLLLLRGLLCWCGR
jgi:hypothetical protein